MKHSEQINELALAMSQLLGEIKDAERDTKAYNYKYADLSQILGIVRPLAAKHGIAFTQHPGNEGAYISLTTHIAHKSGQWMQSTVSIPADAGKNAAQSAGMVISYLRRYAIASIFGIGQADDDGHASETQYKKQDYQPKQTKSASHDAKPVAASIDAKPVDEKRINELLMLIGFYYGEGDKLGVYEFWGTVEEPAKEILRKRLIPEQREWLKNVMINGPRPSTKVDYASV